MTIQLLVRRRSRTTGPPPCVEIAGTTWLVSEHRSLTAANVPPYTCVSYSWGTERVANPFGGRGKVSSRAVSALKAAIAAVQPDAVWLDAVSVPEEEPARTRCLRNMGAVYAAAAKVVVVLPSAMSAPLDAISRGGLVDEAMLSLLETDEWVSRAWTYQEMVNSTDCSFVSEGRPEPVDAARFLDALGFSLSALKKASGLDAFGFRGSHPRLDALESLIADRETAAYLDRSAYQVMTAMEAREALAPDEKYYAMIGAVTQDEFTESDEDPDVSPGEFFMRVCESKGDFSFVYAGATPAAGRRPSWRPDARSLSPVFPWFSSGERQRGERRPGDILRLHGVHRTSPRHLRGPARSFLESTRATLGLDDDATVDGDAALASLQRGGLVSSGPPLELGDGYFLSRSPQRGDGDAVVVVSTEIRFPFGAPALLVAEGDDGARVRDVGVFVGEVPNSGGSIDLS